MNIPSTAITIDDTTAWWVIDLKTAWRRKHDNRPCDTCDGRKGTSGIIPYEYARYRTPCPDCHGTGRHCFTLDVEGECMSIANGRLRRYDGFAISVHVVEVLEIVERDGSIDMAGRLVTHHVTTGLMGSSVTTSIWDGREHLKIITLPADAAPGMYAVRLAVHT
jgi:hypothetical protein